MQRFEGQYLEQDEIASILRERQAKLTKQFEQYGISKAGSWVCDCQGWGCTKCCSSEQEIRSRQGTFS